MNHVFGKRGATRNSRTSSEDRHADVPRPPLHPAARDALAGVFGAAVAVAARGIADYGLIMTAVLGVSGYVGMRMMTAGRELPSVGGMSAREIADSIATARARVDEVATHNTDIPDPQITAMLDAITDRAHAFVDAVAKDPRQLRDARTFLEFHLKGLVDVTGRYAALEAAGAAEPFRPRLMTALAGFRSHLDAATDKLTRHDRFDLDVALDVLKADLSREGLAFRTAEPGSGARPDDDEGEPDPDPAARHDAPAAGRDRSRHTP